MAGNVETLAICDQLCGDQQAPLMTHLADLKLCYCWDSIYFSSPTTCDVGVHVSSDCSPPIVLVDIVSAAQGYYRRDLDLASYDVTPPGQTCSSQGMSSPSHPEISQSLTAPFACAAAECECETAICPTPLQSDSAGKFVPYGCYEGNTSQFSSLRQRVCTQALSP